jgi:hypothetical protein
MKVAITTTKELVDPRLEISIKLESGEALFTLKSTCQECAGWGCKYRDNKCNGGTVCVELKPKDLIKTLGSGFLKIIENLYQQIIQQ